MLGRIFCIQRGGVVYMTLSQLFFQVMVIGSFLLIVGLGEYSRRDTIMKSVKNRRWWWESRTPRRRVFEPLARTRRRTLFPSHDRWGLGMESIALI